MNARTGARSIMPAGRYLGSFMATTMALFQRISTENSISRPNSRSIMGSSGYCHNPSAGLIEIQAQAANT